jgi:hypothetical protein
VGVEECPQTLQNCSSEGRYFLTGKVTKSSHWHPFVIVSISQWNVHWQKVDHNFRFPFCVSFGVVAKTDYLYQNILPYFSVISRSFNSSSWNSTTTSMPISGQDMTHSWPNFPFFLRSQASNDLLSFLPQKIGRKGKGVQQWRRFITSVYCYGFLTP